MAGSIIRKVIKWFFLALNIICCILFLLASLSVFISPVQWPPLGFLSIGVPYVAAVLLLYILFWLIAKPYLAILSAVTLLIGWKQLVVIIAWHPSKTFTEQRNDTAIRVLSWNVRGMYGISSSSYTQHRNRNEIASLVNKLDADIVCLQEFSNLINKKDANADNIGLFTKKSPYYFFSEDFKSKSGNYAAGTIIFSKHKIIRSGKIKYSGRNAESLIYADIIKAGDTIRIFSTHLQSFDFNKEDYINIEKIKDTDAEVLEASESIYTKMKNAFSKRSKQAELVKTESEKSPCASVICGDFNDVPNSYTYFHIRGDRQDAFLKSSFGIGRSYSALAPTLRIDYILPDANFTVNQFEMVDEGLSDHHLLLTDLSIKK
jgi:endonuclease/exonuclease/phosphatase family metal-dependent hydrolase